MKVFSKTDLVHAADMTDTWNFNQGVSNKVRELPDILFPVISSVPHSTRGGEVCEQHMRCVVLLKRDGLPCIGTFDVPLDFYDSLLEVKEEPQPLTAQQMCRHLASIRGWETRRRKQVVRIEAAYKGHKTRRAKQTA